MTAPDRILIHVGYHKTGSTWLQQTLFVGEGHGFHWPWSDRGELNDRFVLVKPLLYDQGAMAGYFEPGLEEARRLGRMPVLSHERLSGNPHSGGYDSAILADRLAELFPAGRVLIVIREQRSMLRSMFNQYVAEGGAASVRRYLHPPRQGRARVPLFDFEFVAYHRLIAYYQGLFGRNQVLVLPFELLRADVDGFVQRLATFAGVDPIRGYATARRNVALSGLAVSIKRRLNRLLVRDSLNHAAPIDWGRANGALLRTLHATDKATPRFVKKWFEQRVQKVVDEAVGDRYRESNRVTEELSGMGLGEYGYLV